MHPHTLHPCSLFYPDFAPQFAVRAEITSNKVKIKPRKRSITTVFLRTAERKYGQKSTFFSYRFLQNFPCLLQIKQNKTKQKNRKKSAKDTHSFGKRIQLSNLFYRGEKLFRFNLVSLLYFRLFPSFDIFVVSILFYFLFNNRPRFLIRKTFLFSSSSPCFLNLFFEHPQPQNYLPLLFLLYD